MCESACERESVRDVFFGDFSINFCLSALQRTNQHCHMRVIAIVNARGS